MQVSLTFIPGESPAAEAPPVFAVNTVNDVRVLGWNEDELIVGLGLDMGIPAEGFVSVLRCAPDNHESVEMPDSVLPDETLTCCHQIWPTHAAWMEHFKDVHRC
jgi:hypothetical protein